ncbi:unnamed protein product [Penicillium nalgiovense]|uniref:14-3-3 domain-containing protein n=1 Tax=Penicillium nalgiovense TaxID=60175 RepID=A0A9W4H9F8_PENNA|nr:unnamed protein product [Penicillium nalgiovense]CAG7939194.1 unnamed protein product [Penicillium nalgiovense]CAG7941985.1 unnamed protein product [Penicillium nalgiovense]CAG7942340.1 unnamed protein product [Penicillium nalgiovense]CAG7958276.1 unnamed protein product [Penicillium nalgiovense]
MTNMADSICPDSPIPGSWALWMASSEVDQKALGNFAAVMGLENPLLSTMLYKVLGVSVMLSKKLHRARKLRRLDTTRETRSLQLYHHIIWLSREGLLILEGYILPMVERFVELKVLAYKLRASFYHIFVLFHNRPAFTPDTDMPTRLKHDSIYGADTLTALGVSDPYKSKTNTESTPTSRPPGLPVLQPVQPPQPISSFLLPPLDYTATATACFNHAATLSDKLLPGSHPLRLSVKLEYAAYLYDCLQDSIACRRLAKQAIADVYNAQEGMDDESFEDAAEIVSVLGKMVKRGKAGSSTGTPGSSISRGGGSRSRSSRSPSHLDISVPTTVSPVPVTKSTPAAGAGGDVSQPNVPDASMMNPI